MTLGLRRAPRWEAIIEGKELADVVLATALDKKALDPAVLAVADVVGYADYFVIVSARNARQVRAIADEVRQVIKHKHGRLPVGVEGLETCRWVLVDYGDVVLHVFQEGTRGFYDLEGLWADAPRLPVPQDDAPGAHPPLFTLP
ncbi:MAG: ribosome silencing factor [Alphaproteobacteria bacterium]|nr:ribosome silencing factor [Alphaproteobacteria bacterium]